MIQLIPNLSSSPSSATLDGVYQISGGFSFKYLTVGKNGGTAETFDLSLMTSDEQSLLVSQNLYVASGEGVNFAFMDSSASNLPPVVNPDYSVTLAVSGFDTDGILTFFGTPYSLLDTVFTLPDGDYEVSSVIVEQNTVEIHRTPGMPLADDAYSYYGGTDDDPLYPPIVFTSCAKIVLSAISAGENITGSNGVDVCNPDNMGYYIQDFPDSGTVTDQKYPTVEALFAAHKAYYDYEPDFAGLLETEADSIYRTGEPSHMGDYMIGERGAGAFVYTSSCN